MNVLFNTMTIAPKFHFIYQQALFWVFRCDLLAFYYNFWKFEIVNDFHWREFVLE